MVKTGGVRTPVFLTNLIIEEIILQNSVPNRQSYSWKEDLWLL